MNNLKLEISLIVVFSSIHFLMTQCPKAEVIHPCICTDSTQDNSSTIICKDTEFIDLRSLLAKASKSVQKKNFTQFILENNPMDKIVSHVFSDLHFTKVHFINCTNLTIIDQDAFGGQTPFMEELVFRNTPILNSPPNELDLFDAVNRLPSLKTMDLSGTQLTTIPDDAFMTILTWLDHQVKHLYFCSDGQLCRSIKSIGKLAFYYLYKVELIDLSRHRISYIDEHAFSIHNLTTKSKLNIILDDNELNAESFHQNAFEFIGNINACAFGL